MPKAKNDDTWSSSTKKFYMCQCRYTITGEAAYHSSAILVTYVHGKASVEFVEKDIIFLFCEAAKPDQDSGSYVQVVDNIFRKWMMEFLLCCETNISSGSGCIMLLRNAGPGTTRGAFTN